MPAMLITPVASSALSAPLAGWVATLRLGSIASWLLTYALHSTLLLGAAWWVSRRLRDRALALQEIVWRCALVGAIVTASAQLALGGWGHLPARIFEMRGRFGSPAAVAAGRLGESATTRTAQGMTKDLAGGAGVGGAVVSVGTGGAVGAGGAGSGNPRAASWLAVEDPAGGRVVRAMAALRSLRMGRGVAAAAVRGLTVVRARRLGGFGAAGLPGRIVAAVSVGGGAAADRGTSRRIAAVGRREDVFARVAGWPGRIARSWMSILMTTWIAGGLLLIVSFLRSFLSLRGRLRNLPRVVGGDVAVRLERLVRKSGFSRPVHLTCTWRLRVPVALGGRPAELCVPPRALFELSGEHQDALLAHELGHLARRDPAWLLISQVLVCLLFFQPLNWMARRRLRDLSELLCDEWAVVHTGRPLSLAGCLTEVAGWSVAGKRAAPGSVERLPVPSMASRPSQLAGRVRRLLDRRAGDGQRLPAPPPKLSVLLAGALIAVTVAVPSFSVCTDPESSDTENGTAAAAAAPQGAAGEGASAAGRPAGEVRTVSDQSGQSNARPAGPAGPDDLAEARADAAGSGGGGAGSAVAAAPAAAPAAPSAAPPAAASGRAPLDGDGGAAPLPDLGEDRERMEAISRELSELATVDVISQEKAAEIAANAERLSREVEAHLRAEMEDLGRKMEAAHAAAAAPPGASPDRPDVDPLVAGAMAQAAVPIALKAIDAEMRQLATELPKLTAEQIKDLDKEIKLDLRHTVDLPQAEVDRIRRETQHLVDQILAHLPSSLPAAEREKILQEAHRLQNQLRGNPDQVEVLRDIEHRRSEITRQLDAQREELQAMHEEIEREAETLRDLARRAAEAHRLNPSLPPGPISPAAPAAPTQPTPQEPPAPPR